MPTLYPDEEKTMECSTYQFQDGWLYSDQLHADGSAYT